MKHYQIFSKIDEDREATRDNLCEISSTWHETLQWIDKVIFYNKSQARALIETLKEEYVKRQLTGEQERILSHIAAQIEALTQLISKLVLIRSMSSAEWKYRYYWSDEAQQYIKQY